MQDPTFWQSFRNTLYMIVAIVVVPTLVGLLLASVLFNLVAPRVGERTAAFLRGSYYLPQILPIAVAGFMWSWILDTDGGALNAVLTAIGVASPPDWLGSADVAIYGIMLMLIWLQLGYPVVIFMAALGRVDPSIYEAADVDGASWWSQFTRITLPELKPEIFIVTLTALVGALKVFAPILILTGGGPEGSTVVPSYYAYRNFFELSRVGYGAAISNVMALLILVIAIGMLVFQRRATDD
jgi:raffinose/stachyose/melibiose transport system permease protein